MVLQLLWLQELLHEQFLTLTWRDARDMAADGHIKGSVGRSELSELAQGHVVQRHEAQVVRLAAVIIVRCVDISGEIIMAGRGASGRLGTKSEGLTEDGNICCGARARGN